MSISLLDQLETVSARLEETLSAFQIAKVVNEEANAEANAALNAAINQRSLFWTTVMNSAQSTYFIGMFALLDTDKDSASLYSLIQEIEKTNPNSIPADLKPSLATIKTRYKQFRHKLFGHNDKNREAFAQRLNAAGFTWTSIAADMGTLDHAFKVLHELAKGRQVPAPADSQKMRFAYNLAVEGVVEHTRALLLDVSTTHGAAQTPTR
ncbi:hypothetical protein EJP67_16655 [Variovorax guangxiensis]|uniref:HEPN AbiU2-like domain-containing protein n=1 Tax=Variovorax guangxiensis TaxID=1775474 RepID=A0A3S0Z4V6_9BURK|nr:hypothetical protein [Variovorax guangxiensis]RUR68694.1 hypothetical protein EJP67_16655 [Variovorax guangxiensis]